MGTFLTLAKWQFRFANYPGKLVYLLGGCTAAWRAFEVKLFFLLVHQQSEVAARSMPEINQTNAMAVLGAKQFQNQKRLRLGSFHSLTAIKQTVFLSK